MGVTGSSSSPSLSRDRRTVSTRDDDVHVDAQRTGATYAMLESRSLPARALFRTKMGLASQPGRAFRSFEPCAGHEQGLPREKVATKLFDGGAKRERSYLARQRYIIRTTREKKRYWLGPYGHPWRSKITRPIFYLRVRPRFP